MRNNVSTKNLNILKASLPFMPVVMQRAVSNFVKIEEFNNMFNDLNSSLDNTLNTCALEAQESKQSFNPSDFLCAIKPYLDKKEVELINMFMNLTKAYNIYNLSGMKNNSESNLENTSNLNFDTFLNNSSVSANPNTSDSRDISSNSNASNNPNIPNSSDTSNNSENTNNINIEALKSLLSPSQRAMFDSYSALLNDNSKSSNQNG